MEKNLIFFTNVLCVQSQEHRPNHVGTAQNVSFRHPSGAQSSVSSITWWDWESHISVSAVWSDKSFITQGAVSRLHFVEVMTEGEGNVTPSEEYFSAACR